MSVTMEAYRYPPLIFISRDIFMSRNPIILWYIAIFLSRKYYYSIYLNDLNDCFDHLCDPIKIHNTSISSLLYADDIVLISNSAEGLQRAMNKLGNFCQVWNLTVNISKTKVIVFNKSGRILKGFAFNFLQTDVDTLYTVDATEYVTAQIDATFHEGREKRITVS